MHNTTSLHGTQPQALPEMLQLNQTALLAMLDSLRSAESLADVRQMIVEIRSQLSAAESRLRGDQAEADRIQLRSSYVISELEQITRTRTLERARYYIDRLIKGCTEIRTSGINDINLNRWKEYEDIYTESLWLIHRRDSSGVHMADYWGNFIPDIPRQMMLRYTSAGEWVLDTFAGSGTTLIEGQRLGRHTLGIELQADIVAKARQRVQKERDLHHVTCDLVVDDCTTVDYPALLQRYGQRSVQLVIMHPPYFDIIKFSEDSRDLSNAASLNHFLTTMGLAIDNVSRVLDHGRYLALVIGDKYADGEWIPLGFYTMQETMQRGFTLKSIIVKNFEETTGKRQQKELWRYRALQHGFYIFKHEYIFLFQKQ